MNSSDKTLDKDFRLFQNFPNPFNPETKINYELIYNGNVVLRIYDINGKEIFTLLNEKQNSGMHSVNFSGSNFSSGIYFYSLFVNGHLIDSKKMLLVK